MKKYLFIVLLVGVGFGQDGIFSIFKSKYPKINCEECGLVLKQTIGGFVCVDQHMRVEKSELKQDKNGNYYLPSKEIRGSYKNVRPDRSKMSWYKIATGTALLNAGINYYLIINDDMNYGESYEDYIEKNKNRNDQIAYSLIVAGISVLLDM